jgi:hypothetical protein
MSPDQPIPFGAVGIPLHDRRGIVRAVALVDETDAPTIERHRWSLVSTKPYYAGRRAAPDGEQRYRTILMHWVVLGYSSPPPGREIDHINHDRLDNRRANLRIVERWQNMQNLRGARSDSRSGVRGVMWGRDAGKWYAQIRLRGQGHFLGYYSTIEEAAAVVAAARAQHMPFSDEARSGFRGPEVRLGVAHPHRRASGRLAAEGVSWHRQSRKWNVRLTADGKRHNLGLYVNREDAERVAAEFRASHNLRPSAI